MRLQCAAVCGVVGACAVLAGPVEGQDPQQLYTQFYQVYRQLPDTVSQCRIDDRSRYMTAYENLYAYTILTRARTFESTQRWLRGVLVGECLMSQVQGSGGYIAPSFVRKPSASDSPPAGMPPAGRASAEAEARIADLERQLRSADLRVRELEAQLQSALGQTESAGRQLEDAQAMIQRLRSREQAVRARPDGCWALAKAAELAGEPALLCVATDRENGKYLAWAITDDGALRLGSDIRISGSFVDVSFEDNSGRIGLTVDQTGSFATGSWNGGRMISFTAIRLLSGQ